LRIFLMARFGPRPSGKPTGMPRAVMLKTFAIKVIEESVHVEF
jgi:hypothetical protein